MTPLAFPRLVATLGTTTDDPAVLAGMARAGMGLARVNTAYVRPDEIARRLELLSEATSVPALLDLKGRQIRVDCTSVRPDASGAPVERPCRYPIARGDLVFVGFRTGPVRFNHDFAEDIDVGDVVLFDNGTIRARVEDPRDRGVQAVDRAVLLEILDAGSGHMTPGMGANVPGRRLDVPSLTDRDRAAIAVGVAHQVAWYALSFVQHPDDLQTLHEALLAEGDAIAGLVAKIEEPVGIGALDAITAGARATGRPFAVMIARGDLHVELGPIELFAAQEALVAACRRLVAPSIVATGLLLSMTTAPRPARSEVCDVAAALRMGADSLMLSDETSNGQHPVAAVETLAALIARYGS